MSKNIIAPPVRFQGFTEPWEQHKLGELSDKVTTKNVRRQYVETLTNSAEHGIVGQKDYFDHNISNMENIDGYYIVENNDFVYNPRISTSAPCGPINRNKLGRVGIISPLYTVFKPHDVDVHYLEGFFKSTYWHKFMYFNGDTGARSDRFSIKDTSFFNMPISIPSIDEQYKIGAYLQSLDRLITLHQHKLEQQKKLKKYFLQNMFPEEGETVPRIRFKGFTGDWEQRKILDIAPLQRGFDLPKANMKFGSYPVVMSNGIEGYHSEYKVKGPGVVTGRSGTIGKVHYVESDFWPHNTTLWVTDFKSNLPKFIYYLYEWLDLSRFGTGSGVPTLNRNDVHDTKVAIPVYGEQKKIADCLEGFDHLITLHQRKIDQLQAMKKFMLQNLFV